MPERTRIVGVDWGSTRLRAWLVGSDGTTEASLAVEQGVLFGRADDLRAALEGHLAEWLGQGVDLVVGVGMLGSRTGVLDAGYVGLPAGRALWAAAARPAGTLRGTPLVLLPGLVKDGPEPDVMRGEEFQVFAALESGAGDGTFVCPGTHSKWIRTQGGRIVDFRTYATGELYATWCAGSSLTDLVGAVDQTAGGFDHALSAARRPATSTLAAIFALRAGVLTGQLKATHAFDALSGLLIGREVTHALDADELNGPLRVIGGGDLADRYVRAITAADREVRTITIDSARALAGLDDSAQWGRAR